MTVPFLKMNGLGNDFVVLDTRGGGHAPAPATIQKLANRRFGIGFDQLIVIEPGRPGADIYMRIFNPDGSEAGACGNATRCVGRMVFEETGKGEAVVETVAGKLHVWPAADGLVTADMGEPRLKWDEIPLAREMDTRALDLTVGPEDEPVLSKPGAVNMGNPHCVFFVRRAPTKDIESFGPLIENHALFPEKTNVGFAEIQGRHAIRLRVWERGTGVTLACGSGACAAAVAAHRRGHTDRAVDVELDGGTLHIDWREDTNHVHMTGPADLNYEGTLDLAHFSG
jgi:diaminopimelate epimerase